MSLTRLARKLLALTIAYSIVLGGVIGPAAGHGFDPAQELCSPVGSAAGADPRGDRQSQHAGQDCCFLYCAAGVAILPPAVVIKAAGWRSADIRFPIASLEVARPGAFSHLARAPPHG